MIRFLATLGRWADRPPSEAAAEPTLAGYRKSSPRLFKILGLAGLILAGMVYGYLFGVVAPARVMPFLVPVALLGGLILWTLPPGEYAPTGAIQPLFLAFFVSLVLWPNYLAIAIGNLPWLTLLRITGIPLVTVLLACISISQKFRNQFARILTGDRMMVQLVVALTALWGGSILLSSDPSSSINRYILAILNFIAIFFVSCYLFNRKGFAELWVKLFLLMLGVVCLLAIWEFKLQALPWAGHIPSFLKIEDPAVQNILRPGYAAGVGQYRVKGTATTPLGLAELVGLSAPFAVHLVLAKYPIVVRWAAALYLPLAVVVIFLTDSRLGFVALCASVLFYLLFWGILRWRAHKNSLLGPAIVLSYPGVFVAFMAATFLVDRLHNQFWGRGAQQSSTQGRLDQWKAGFPKIVSHPLGHGIGQAGVALGFSNAAGEITIDSYWLSVLMEIGIIGFFVFYGLMIRGAFAAARAVTKSAGHRELELQLPLAVVMIDFIIVKMVFSQDANHSVIFMVLGAIVALSYRTKQLPVSDPAKPGKDAVSRRDSPISRR